MCRKHLCCLFSHNEKKWLELTLDESLIENDENVFIEKPLENAFNLPRIQHQIIARYPTNNVL